MLAPRNAHSTQPLPLGGSGDPAKKAFSGPCYYPFGMMMPHPENTQAGGHRFGYQGQLADDELHGDQNSYAFKARMHDPRIGRFLSIDPLAKKYPHNSPYAFSENRVIDAFELEGEEAKRVAEREGAFGPIIPALDNGRDHQIAQKFADIESKQDATWIEATSSTPHLTLEPADPSRTYEIDLTKEQKLQREIQTNLRKGQFLQGPVVAGGPGFGRGMANDPFIKGAAIGALSTFGGIATGAGAFVGNSGGQLYASGGNIGAVDWADAGFSAFLKNPLGGGIASGALDIRYDKGIRSPLFGNKSFESTTSDAVFGTGGGAIGGALGGGIGGSFVGAYSSQVGSDEFQQQLDQISLGISLLRAGQTRGGNEKR